MGARCHGNNENVVLLLHQEVEQEEKVNEQRAFPNARLSAGFFELHSHFQLGIKENQVFIK